MIKILNFSDSVKCLLAHNVIPQVNGTACYNLNPIYYYKIKQYIIIKD